MPSKSHQSKSRSKCLRPGPVGRNPYLNFLREFRKKCCGYSAIETVRQGAKAWHRLKPEERRRFIVEAFYAPKQRRRSMHGGISKHRIGRISGRRSGKPKNKHSGKSPINRRGSKRTSRSGTKRSRSSSKTPTTRRKSEDQTKPMCY